MLWASIGVVEKSVGMFKRALGGCVEYSRHIGIREGLCRNANNVEAFEGIRDTIRILSETWDAQKLERDS